MGSHVLFYCEVPSHEITNINPLMPGSLTFIFEDTITKPYFLSIERSLGNYQLLAQRLKYDGQRRVLVSVREK